ncbi:MAG TPA: O-antigen ligase family protein [Acidiphilium sp.]
MIARAFSARSLLQDRTLGRIALGLVFLVPLFLFYGRAIADGLISSTAILFLVRSRLQHDWSWVRRPWVPFAGALWLLILVASVAAGPVHSMLEALVMIRLLLFCAALESWVLVSPQRRNWLGVVMAAMTVWLIFECWQQYLTGHNIAGFPRWPDGSLTGPFFKPRAGGTFLVLLFPGVMPFVLILIQSEKWRLRVAGGGVLAFLFITMVLIGQRMPSLLMLLGLAIGALIVRRFRIPVLVAFTAGIAVLLALPVISPPTYGKLVVETAKNLSNFPASPYGLLYTRAVVMVIHHPWLGLGFDGFRDFCSNPIYFHGLRAYGIPTAIHQGLGGCNLHPHNYYLQIATAAGLSGLVLFLVMIGLWFIRVAGSLAPRRAPQQAALFLALCCNFWPIASTSSLFTLPTAGWVFLTVGWALAASSRRGATENLFDLKQSRVAGLAPSRIATPD